MSVAEALGMTADDMPVLSGTTASKDESGFPQWTAEGLTQGGAAADTGTCGLHCCFAALFVICCGLGQVIATVLPGSATWSGLI